jgi:fatty acid desaturase
MDADDAIVHGMSEENDAEGSPETSAKNERKQHMLMTIAILLVVLYALGLVTSYTMGGLIHILLVLAVVVVLVRLIQGRQAL